MYQSAMVTRVSPVPHKQYVLKDLMFVAVVDACAAEEADCIGDADRVEVGSRRVAEGGAQDVADFVAGGGRVVDCGEGEAKESAVGSDDLMVRGARGHVLLGRCTGGSRCGREA